MNKIIGNKKAFGTLTSLLKKNQNKGIYLLHGPSGTGKTSFVENFNKEYKMLLVNVTVSSTALNEDALKKVFAYTFLKKLIIIDDCDLATSDESITKRIINNMNTVIKCINTSSRILVFIISKECVSTFKNIKDVNIIKFTKVREEAIKKYVVDVLEERKIVINEKVRDKILKDIIDKSNGNVRKVMTNIELLVSSKNNIKYTQKNITMMGKFNQDKTYKNLTDIFYSSLKETDLNDTYAKESLYRMEPFKIGSAVFEYYPKFKAFNKNETTVKDMETLAYISEGLAISDLRYNEYNVYDSLIGPTCLGRGSKGSVFFPACVSKISKINTNIKKYGYSEYKEMEVMIDPSLKFKQKVPDKVDEKKPKPVKKKKVKKKVVKKIIKKVKPVEEVQVDVSKMKVTELKAECKRRGLKGYSKLKKDTLLELLK